MEKKEIEKDSKLLFYVEPLDPKTNQVISEMFTELGTIFEKKFSIKTEEESSLSTPVWECGYRQALRIVMAKKLLDLKFKLWLLNSDEKTLDRRGEFFFKNYLG